MKPPPPLFKTSTVYANDKMATGWGCLAESDGCHYSAQLLCALDEATKHTEDFISSKQALCVFPVLADATPSPCFQACCIIHLTDLTIATVLPTEQHGLDASHPTAVPLISPPQLRYSSSFRTEPAQGHLTAGLGKVSEWDVLIPHK